ncbi:MAG: nuclease-related domain-containing protein [Gemmatimonadota bacterium]|nr:nuclease-related domain-containing protein [Gemmatimonadota bacterium]
MLIIPELFPPERRHDPKRRAEAGVFDNFAGSPRRGHAIYEWGALGRPHCTDFALWLEDVARFAIEVKGGRYTYEVTTGQWYLHTPEGLVARPSPLRQADDSAIDLRNEINDKTGFRVFIIPVVVFPDMERNAAIESCAQRTNVKVVWGTGSLIADLEAAAQGVVINHPPRAKHIANEVRAVTHGAGAADGEAADKEVLGEEESARSGNTAAGPAVEQLELTAAHITIHHVEQLIVQQATDPTLHDRR